MSKNIYFAQTKEEINFILSNLKEEAICVPLNLSTHLYCINNNINYCNPINLIEKKFHHKALLESDRLIKNIDSGNIKYDSVLKEFTSAIRHRFYSAYFLVELINKIDLNEKINKIYISGWNGNFNYNSDTDYFISYLVKTLFKKFKIYEFSNQTNKKNNKTNVKYLLRPKKKFNGKTFFLNNLGYKFTRILFFCFKNGYTVITLDQKLSFIKRFIFLISGVKFVSFVKSEEKRESQIYIPDINFKSDDIDFSEILTKKKNQELSHLNILEAKCDALDNFIGVSKISMIVSNISRGIHGFLAETGKKHNIPTLCISHGTIAKSFNNIDKIYKKIIAEAVFGGKFKFFSLQSKIARDSVETHLPSGKTVETGNLIFQEGKRKKKLFIMFAVTLKNFENLQFLGVEMYYEFLENLKFFDNLSKRENFKFLIKLPPGSKKNMIILKKCFKNLVFTDTNLKKNILNSLLTISYSSTVIEDSLYCRVPVILFDRWNRYQHCDAQNNPNVTDEAIYYVTNENDLLTAIQSIKKSKSFQFNKYIYPATSKENIRNLFTKVLWENKHS